MSFKFWVDPVLGVIAPKPTTPTPQSSFIEIDFTDIFALPFMNSR